MKILPFFIGLFFAVAALGVACNIYYSTIHKEPMQVSEIADCQEKLKRQAQMISQCNIELQQPGYHVPGND